jgi:hypothetical protein
VTQREGLVSKMLLALGVDACHGDNPASGLMTGFQDGPLLGVDGVTEFKACAGLDSLAYASGA